METYNMQHSGAEIDACVDDVSAAKGSSASLAAAMTAEATARASGDSALGTLEAADRAALADLIDSGAKNRANPISAEGYSGQGNYPIERAKVTFTLNANGTITTSTDPGVPSSATTTLKIPVTLKAGETYMISGCPAGGSDSTYRIDIRLAGTSTVKAYDYGSGATFTAEQTDYDLCIRYPSQKNAAETFSPMICPSAAYAISSAFVPYVPSNAELWAMIQS